jgi:hypothetical protein
LEEADDENQRLRRRRESRQRRETRQGRARARLDALSVGHQQRPYIANESSGSFYFFSPNVAVTTPLPQTPNTSDEAVREDRFWDDAKFAGNREGFEAYLDAYPKGRYASLARANLARLSSAAAVGAVTVPLPNANIARPAAVSGANASVPPVRWWRRRRRAEDGVDAIRHRRPRPCPASGGKPCHCDITFRRIQPRARRPIRTAGPRRQHAQW